MFEGTANIRAYVLNVNVLFDFLVEKKAFLCVFQSKEKAKVLSLVNAIIILFLCT